MPRHEYYDNDGNVTKEQCPRCGDAFLARHENRQHCGKCGYTVWD